MIPIALCRIKLEQHESELSMLLSLFAGCGGLDTGFEQDGYEIGLAYDKRQPAIESYNHNRKSSRHGHVRDISTLTLEQMDLDYGSTFNPTAVIGGPPCQSFSKANRSKIENDPRTEMVSRFFLIAANLHARRPLDFIVMENVPEVARADNGRLLAREIKKLEDLGFLVSTSVLNSVDYGVPQTRKRLFLVAINSERNFRRWSPPTTQHQKFSVKDAIGTFPDPIHFKRGINPSEVSFHPNHWCMAPKSKRFSDGTLTPGRSSGRCFKTLSWDRPSYTASYGNREVHIHPNCQRRLSVYEAMCLQGFPIDYELRGTMSAQFSQVSEAVPPPLACALAGSITLATKPALPNVSADTRLTPHLHNLPLEVTDELA